MKTTATRKRAVETSRGEKKLRTVMKLGATRTRPTTETMRRTTNSAWYLNLVRFSFRASAVGVAMDPKKLCRRTDRKSETERERGARERTSRHCWCLHGGAGLLFLLIFRKYPCFDCNGYPGTEYGLKCQGEVSLDLDRVQLVSDPVQIRCSQVNHSSLYLDYYFDGQSYIYIYKVRVKGSEKNLWI